MNRLSLIGILVLSLIFNVSCNQFERVTKKFAGGLSELISEAVDGVVQATIKIIFLGVLDTQEDGTQVLSFEAETASGRAFKGVALGSSNALSSGEVALKGKAFEIQGEPVLLANAVASDGRIPLVMIAVETDTLITQPSLGRPLSDMGMLELTGQTLNQGSNSPTVFRYIGETEKNLTLLGIGQTRLDLNAGTLGELLEWQSSGDFRLQGNIIETSVGSTLEADLQLRTMIGNEPFVIDAISFSVILEQN